MREPIRIAMWSGPRNISTALMRSFENRRDTAVVDEPFYACFLDATGIDHPGRDETLAACERDADVVAASLGGPVPGGRAVSYQKHMTHHMVPGLPLAWMSDVRHAFLIRDPRDVILSYMVRRPDMTADDIGFVRQTELFDHVCELTGRVPPVIDARDVLFDPRATLSALCARLRIPFDDGMLAWPVGSRTTDGVWAKYWYDAVERSSGFAPYRANESELPARYAEIEALCRPHYERMAEHRIGAC
jgi:hypothetical protein